MLSISSTIVHQVTSISVSTSSQNLLLLGCTDISDSFSTASGSLSHTLYVLSACIAKLHPLYTRLHHPLITHDSYIVCRINVVVDAVRIDATDIIAWQILQIEWYRLWGYFRMMNRQRPLRGDDRLPFTGVCLFLDDSFQNCQLFRFGLEGLMCDNLPCQLPFSHNVCKAELIQVGVPTDMFSVPLASQLVTLLQLKVMDDPSGSYEILDFESMPRGGVQRSKIHRVYERSGIFIVFPLHLNLPRFLFILFKKHFV
mmetsp:Transcript_2290/g.4937  ORF Transcript_2290/g.4937 Transcript_2290/m.4937 type:complete len:256 (-) Transcript_2290:685-1452(-)